MTATAADTPVDVLAPAHDVLAIAPDVLLAPVPVAPDRAPAPTATHIAPCDATVIPLLRPRRRATETAPDPRPVQAAELPGVPCAARPSTGFRHLDGPCECFFGGPAPVFPAAFDPAANS